MQFANRSNLLRHLRERTACCYLHAREALIPATIEDAAALDKRDSKAISEARAAGAMRSTSYVPSQQRVSRLPGPLRHFQDIRDGQTFVYAVRHGAQPNHRGAELPRDWKPWKTDAAISVALDRAPRGAACVAP